MLLYRWDPTVYIVSMSYIKINYYLTFDVKLYCLKGCVIMTSKQKGGKGFSKINFNIRHRDNVNRGILSVQQHYVP